MEFTGERVIPGRTDPDLMNEHLARYRFAEALVRGKRVLDAGCGVGYGSKLLSGPAEAVGVSLDSSATRLRREFEEGVRFKIRSWIEEGLGSLHPVRPLRARGRPA